MSAIPSIRFWLNLTVSDDGFHWRPGLRLENGVLLIVQAGPGYDSSEEDGGFRSVEVWRPHIKGDNWYFGASMAPETYEVAGKGYWLRWNYAPLAPLEEAVVRAGGILDVVTEGVLHPADCMRRKW